MFHNILHYLLTDVGLCPIQQSTVLQINDEQIHKKN